MLLGKRRGGEKPLEPFTATTPSSQLGAPSSGMQGTGTSGFLKKCSPISHDLRTKLPAPRAKSWELGVAPPPALRPILGRGGG